MPYMDPSYGILLVANWLQPIGFLFSDGSASPIGEALVKPLYTPTTNSSHLKNTGWKTIFYIFSTFWDTAYFQGLVSFRRMHIIHPKIRALPCACATDVRGHQAPAHRWAAGQGCANGEVFRRDARKVVARDIANDAFLEMSGSRRVTKDLNLFKGSRLRNFLEWTKESHSVSWCFVHNVLPSCCHCWWKKSCPMCDVSNPVNHGTSHLSTGAGFLPSTVLYNFIISACLQESIPSGSNSNP